MGEFVERSLEDLVPTFEQLQRVQIFSPAETQQIIKKCRQLEYRIQKQVKQCDDFVRYADYLNNVYMLVHKRRRQVDYWQKRNEIEDVLNLKIDSIYRRVCDRFPQNIELWQQRIDFNKRRKRHDSVSKIYSRMLLVHNSRVDVWTAAADYECSIRGAFAAGRALLQSALRTHSTALPVYLALLRCELLFVDKLRERRKLLLDATNGATTSVSSPLDDITSDASDAVLELVNIVVDEMQLRCTAAQQLEFMHTVATSVVNEFKCTDELARRCADTLMHDTRFDALPTAWVYRASLILSPVQGDDEYMIDSAVGKRQQDERVFQILERGIAVVADKTEMYDHALAFLRKLVSDRLQDEQQSEYRLAKYMQMLQASMPFVSDRELEAFANILPELSPSGQITNALLTDALHRFPKNVTLWHRRIVEAIRDESLNSVDIRKLFNKAMRQVSADASAPLWLLGVQYTRNDVAAQRALLSSSFETMPPNVTAVTKTLYLQSLLVHDDTERLHTEFIRLARARPNADVFYREYIRMRACDVQCTPDEMRDAFEEYAGECGRTSADVWLAYARWIATADPLRAGALYERVKMTLKNTIEYDRFLAEYTVNSSADNMIMG